MIVRRTIDKDELKELPKTVFPGRIYVIQSEAETERAVAYLQSRSVIGIDSETRPSFTKGQSHKVEKYQPSYAVRTSMSDYREQDWMTNIPLYAIKWIENYVNQ